MQRYENDKLELLCNKCGKMIKVQQNIPKEDVFHAEKVWGYFSEKDGVRHRWDMCERCYGELIRGFAIPLEEMQETEYL